MTLIMVENKEILKQYQAIVSLPFNLSDTSDDPFETIVGNLLDEIHDKIDLASWQTVKQNLFSRTKDNMWELDLEKMKIEELDQLFFYPCEFVLMKQLCLKDDYSLEHSLRVMAISLRVAHIFSLTDDQKTLLAKSAGLHDIGKASVNPENEKDYIEDYILKSYKIDAATQKEMRCLQKHVEYGVKDLTQAYQNSGIDNPSVIDLISVHHERMDGSGYPNGVSLAEDDLLPQILAFADTIEAMTATQRVYQKTHSFEEIKAIFRTHLIGKFSQKILNLIINDQTRGLIEFEVKESESATEKYFY